MEGMLTSDVAAEPIRQLGAAASAALTDGMVERLVATGTTGLEVLDRLNDPDTKAAVHRVLDGLTALHVTGGLDTLFELVDVAHAARSAASDSMVERLTVFLETMASNLATQEIAELARDVERALYDAGQRCANEPPRNLFSVLRRLFTTDGVKTMNLMLTFGKCWHERALAHAGVEEPR
jgi:hypothetical protein